MIFRIEDKKLAVSRPVRVIVPLGKALHHALRQRDGPSRGKIQNGGINVDRIALVAIEERSRAADPDWIPSKSLGHEFLGLPFGSRGRYRNRPDALVPSSIAGKDQPASVRRPSDDAV